MEFFQLNPDELDFEPDENDSLEEAENSDVKKTSQEDVSEEEVTVIKEVKKVDVSVVTTDGSQSLGQTASQPRLPEGWSAHVSSSFPGKVYYFNKVTGATTWSVEDIPPTPSSPLSRLPDLGLEELQRMLREQEQKVAGMKKELVVGDRPGSSRGGVVVGLDYVAGGEKREVVGEDDMPRKIVRLTEDSEGDFSIAETSGETTKDAEVVQEGGGEVKEKQGQRRVCKFSSDEEEDESE